MAAKKKAKPVGPQSAEEARALLEEVTSLQLQIEAMELRAEKTATRLRERTATRIAPLSDEISRKLRQLAEFATANRTTLTDSGSKTIELGGGNKISWRLRPASLEFDCPEAEVINALKAINRKDLINIKETVNREKLEAEPSIIKSLQGVGWKKRQEDMLIQPARLIGKALVRPPRGKYKIEDIEKEKEET